jgi:hypothetical protein
VRHDWKSNLLRKSRVTVPSLMVPVNGVLLEHTRMYGGVPDATAAVKVPRSCPDEVTCVRISGHHIFSGPRELRVVRCHAELGPRATASVTADGDGSRTRAILDDATEPSWELTASWPLNEIQRLLGLLERHKDPSE